MADLSAYYNEIKNEKNKLDEKFLSGFLFVTAVRNVSKGNMTGGTVTEVNTYMGAKHLVDVTARISTPEEIAAFKLQGENFTARMNAHSHGGQAQGAGRYREEAWIIRFV
jgi:hypothetical protein